jgi:prevent-host-death family protein
MRMSVREARAQFAAALDAAARGERVTITRNGEAVAELGPPSPAAARFSWERVDRAREAAGIAAPAEPLDEAWRERFDDPEWIRGLLRAGDDGEDEIAAQP